MFWLRSGHMRAPLALCLLAGAWATAAGCHTDDTAGAVACGAGTTLDAGVCLPNAANDGGGPAAPVAPTFGGATAVAPASLTTLLVTWNDATSPTTPPERMRYAVFIAGSASSI